jgi:hypothetical protein
LFGHQKMHIRPTSLFVAILTLASAVFAFGGVGVGLTAIVFMAAFRLRRTRMFGTMATDMIVILIAGLLFVGIPWMFVQAVLSENPESHNRDFCTGHMQQILVALYAYNEVHGQFPPAYIADKAGRPMHSWRVLILPYLKCKSLYKQYDFSEPWDGPHNRKLLASRPRAYVCPSDKESASPTGTSTSYVAVVGPDAAWSGDKPRRPATIDPRNRTVMLAETTGSDIPWTEPADFQVDPRGKEDIPQVPPGRRDLPTVLSSCHYPSGFYFHIPRPKVHVALADGRVAFVPEKLVADPTESPLFKIGSFPEEYADKSWPAEAEGIDWPNCIFFTVWATSVGLLLVLAYRSRKKVTEQDTK